LDETVLRCLDSLVENTNYQNFEVILMETLAVGPEPSLNYDRYRPALRLKVVNLFELTKTVNLYNHAVSLSAGEYVCFLNADVEAKKQDWLYEMVSLALMPKVGAVGARIWDTEGRLWHGGIILGLGGIGGYAHKYCPYPGYGYWGRGLITQAYSAVSSVCLLVNKAAYEFVGGFSSIQLPMLYRDIDFCLKLASAGYRNLWNANAELCRFNIPSDENLDPVEMRVRYPHEFQTMKIKWGKSLENDPAYNPNLTLDKENFDLAWPPRIVIK